MFDAMDWPAFWTTAFTGVAAVLVGFGTVTFGYLLARRDDRRDAARHAGAARVGRVQSAVYGDLARAMSWRWLPVGSGVLKVAQAVAEFASAELAEHPAVALWTTERLESIGERVRRAERGWLLPGDSRRRSALMSAASEVATMLVGWQSGAVKEEWFTANLSKHGRETVAALPPRRRSLR